MVTEPTILGILCHWCAYSAADSAAAAKLPVVHNLRTMRVMCTGRVDPTLVVRALQRGADGVLVCGCHPGDCHYISGNCRALGRFLLLKRLLTELGIEPERLRLEWISAQEGARYVEVAAEMTAALRPLGTLHWPNALADVATAEDDEAARDGA